MAALQMKDVTISTETLEEMLSPISEDIIDLFLALNFEIVVLCMGLLIGHR